MHSQGQVVDVEMHIEHQNEKPEQHCIKTNEPLTQQQNGGNGSSNCFKHDPKGLMDHE